VTFREYLQVQWRARLPRLLVFCLPAVVFPETPWGRDEPIAGIALLPLFVAGFAWIWRSMRKVACPRCQQPLGPFASNLANASNRNPRRDQCPNCGLGLDDTVPN
jgi:hypothetical protein